MSEIRTIQVGDLTIEAEVFSAVNGPLDVRDCFLTVRAPSGFEVGDCKTEEAGPKASIFVNLAREHTAEDEQMEAGDLLCHLHRDEGRR
jgi:hypothetical protein